MRDKFNTYIYNHNGDDYGISFLFNNKHQMINATEMSKPFGKLPHDWLRLSSTKEYMKALVDAGKSLNVESLVVTKKGGFGGGGGVWLNKDLAIENARWLSPKLAIWCNDKIFELFQKGVVYLITAEPNKLDEHVIPQVQRNNTKAIAKKIYEPNKNRQELINYFRNLSFKIMGVHPKTIVSHAKNNGVPLSVINKGSREILRYYSSSATACMSLIENIISSNPNMTIDNVDELMPHVITLESFFAKMIEIGHYDSKELKKIRGYENLKKSLNEK